MHSTKQQKPQQTYKHTKIQKHQSKNRRYSKLQKLRRNKKRKNKNPCSQAASWKVAKVYPGWRPLATVRDKNAHLNVNDFNGRTRKNLEPVLFITLTLSLSKLGWSFSISLTQKTPHSRSVGRSPTTPSPSPTKWTPQDSWLLHTVFISAAFVRSWNLSALSLQLGKGTQGELR